MKQANSTICAIASAPGNGAIAVIRISGEDSFDIVSKIIKKSEKFLKLEHSKTIYTSIIDQNNETIDDVICVKFYAPHSYTGENSVEIYCHGSDYIQREILQCLIMAGASIAEPGEYTKRAFLNGKIDLSQAEAVADLIAGSTKEAHRISYNQLKGNVSSEIKQLREELIKLHALIELELDFSEEDVEFADRNQIIKLIDIITEKIQNLINTFRYGHAIKNGIPVVIAGEPNVGKSSLLNTLLNDDRAIVSDIPGTTRDTIEEEFILDGYKFRIIDTAGIRESNDTIENLGIQRTYNRINKAEILILMTDVMADKENFLKNFKMLSDNIDLLNKYIILAINKSDLSKTIEFKKNEIEHINKIIYISAKTGKNIDALKKELSDYVKKLKPYSANTIISSMRQYEILKKALESLKNSKKSILSGISNDLVSEDIREATYYLSEVTGNISNEEVLGAIFEKFCIGK